MVRLVAAIGLSLVSDGALSAAVFQYAVPVTTAKGQSAAYLWIPPMALQIRGVVMAGMTLMERQFAEDAQIRQACAAQQLAIAFLKCGLSATDLQQVLDDLAVRSGYRELSVAPLLFVGHSAGGPQAKAAAIRIQFDALAPASEGSRVTFLAYSEGDAEYRYTEHIGMLPRGFRGLKKGKPQTISLAPIGDLKANAQPQKLHATSDSGLPVEFYVAYGPAMVTNGLLQVAELPARAQYPLPVKVVAYQFGRGVDPVVQTAAPVEQMVHIESP